MRTSKYLRKATKQFICSKCGKPICTGTEYIDLESVDHSIVDTIIVKHIRMHKDCDKPKVYITKDCLPIAVGYLGNKERLVGKVFFVDRWYLLTQDWQTDKYYKRGNVHDYNGNVIKPEDVEL